MHRGEFINKHPPPSGPTPGHKYYNILLVFAICCNHFVRTELPVSDLDEVEAVSVSSFGLTFCTAGISFNN